VLHKQQCQEISGRRITVTFGTDRLQNSGSGTPTSGHKGLASVRVRRDHDALRPPLLILIAAPFLSGLSRHTNYCTMPDFDFSSIEQFERAADEAIDYLCPKCGEWHPLVMGGCTRE
jgi:hypothetical protein